MSSPGLAAAAGPPPRPSLDDSELLPFALDFGDHSPRHLFPSSGSSAQTASLVSPLQGPEDEEAVEGLIRLLQAAPPLNRGKASGTSTLGILLQHQQPRPPGID